MSCCTLFTCLGLSVSLLPLCLNSVCHGSRTELQPRWHCRAPSTRCSYALEVSEFALTLSVSLHRVWVSLTWLLHVPGVLCALTFARSRCLVCPDFCTFQVSCVLGTRGESPAHVFLPKPLPCPSHSFICTGISRPPAVHRKAGASCLLEHVASLALHLACS